MHLHGSSRSIDFAGNACVLDPVECVTFVLLTGTRAEIRQSNMSWSMPVVIMTYTSLSGVIAEERVLVNWSLVLIKQIRVVFVS